MGEVLDFTARRLAQLAPKPPTVEELTEDALHHLLTDWEKMARNNRLNVYFKNTVPNLRHITEETNFMSDLNEIARLELNIELFPIVFFPGTRERKQLGWIVQFKIGNNLISTPELASEAYARCFAILLFLKLKRDVIAAGLM